jgi:serine/threonine protein kinase
MTDPLASEVLRRFLLGELSDPELDRVAAYLDRHPDVANTLNALNVSDTLLDALKRHERTDDSPAVAALITRLSEMSAAPDAPTTDPEAGASGNVLAMLEPSDQPGALGQLGRYRVLRVLGRGSVGVVFEAEEDQLKRRVVLKVMLPERAADSVARKRFVGEAIAAARIEHNNVVPICDVAEANGVPFLTMPLLVGATLDERLNAGALPVADVLLFGRHVAEGLAAGHAAGLVHGAIKPSNVWLEREPTGVFKRARILDFGPTRAFNDTELTHSSANPSALAYTAPEQARGEPLDHRADLFGLGCILYQMATGQCPFRGADARAVSAAVATETPPAPHHLNPTVPVALSALIELLLSKNPINRWPPTAHEVGDELFRIANDPLSLSGPRPGLPSVPARPTMRATAVPKPEEVWPGATEADEANEAASKSADEVPMATAVEEQPHWRRWGWVFAACAVLALVGYYSETIVHFATDKGELVIEVDNPNIEVMVVRGDSVLVDKTNKRSFVIKSGEGEVIFFYPESDVILLTTKFELTRGGQVTVHMRTGEIREPRPKP